MASVIVAGDVSGTCTLQAPSVAGSTVLTLPVIATDTLAGIAATQTLTNKTLTSPVLTTPALGTPASGVLTNCTGVAKAALPAGSVLQVVHFGYSATVSNSTTTFADTGVTATITPSSASSKILILISMTGLEKSAGNSLNSINLQIMRGVTVVRLYAALVGYTGSVLDTINTSAFNYLDSPASTSALTYKVQFKNYNASAAVYCQSNAAIGDQSTITLMEIQG